MCDCGAAMGAPLQQQQRNQPAPLLPTRSPASLLALCATISLQLLALGRLCELIWDTDVFMLLEHGHKHVKKARI
jgi:hypothetical protein